MNSAAAKNRRVRLNVSRLEDRSVPAVTASFAPVVGVGDVLTVTGDAGDNDIRVELLSGKVAVSQKVLGVYQPVTIGGAPTTGITLKALARVLVNAGDGDDIVEILPTITKPAVLNGDLGSDNLMGGKGNDTIITGTDANGDTADGGDGNDSITGGAGDDFLTGGKGNDTIVGGNGVNNLVGGEGNDSLTGGTDTDDIFGGDGADSINGGDGDDRLRGDDPLGKKPGNDSINGGAGLDIIVGGKGNDRLDGGTDNDVLEGGDGNDTLIGGPELDASFTGGPDDAGAGDADVDSLFGGNGNDAIFGGWGNDLIFGEAGNDALKGGVGQDIISGGLGQDSFVGHGTTGGNSGQATLEGNFDTYRDEYNLALPVNKKLETKDIAPTELDITAALAGIAAVAGNQSAFNITTRLRYLGTGEFLVKLGPSDEINPDPGSPNPVGWVPVQFDGSWTDNDPRPNGAERFALAKDSREFWTVLLHRAVTQSFNGAYDPFAWYSQADYEILDARLTDSGDVIEGLTGNGAATFDLSTSPAGFNFAAITSNLVSGLWLTAQSKAMPTLVGIQASHSYSITKAFVSSGIEYLTLYNASGFDGGAVSGATIDQKGKISDDGFITIKATDFFANFGFGFVN